jgi:hypothetical protein
MKDIEQYLRQNKPETPDEGQFIIETNARLSSVEGIKDTVDAERHRGRLMLVIALVAGLVIGCLLTLFVMFFPVPSAETELSAFSKAIVSLKKWETLLLVPVAACAVALGILLMNRKKEVL